MELQRRELFIKDWEKQQKELKKLKNTGKSKEKAEGIALRKQNQKNKRNIKSTGTGMEAAEDKQVNLLERPTEYKVVFTFPEVKMMN